MALETEVQNGLGTGKDMNTAFKDGVEDTGLKNGSMESEKLAGK